jgi:hypothetical protein
MGAGGHALLWLADRAAYLDNQVFLPVSQGIDKLETAISGLWIGEIVDSGDIQQQPKIKVRVVLQPGQAFL